MYTLSNTGKTITFGMDEEAALKLFPSGYAKFGYNSRSRMFWVSPSTEGKKGAYKIKADSKSSGRHYVTVHSKYGPTFFPKFGRIDIENITTATQPGFMAKLPSELPEPRPLSEHEREVQVKETVLKEEDVSKEPIEAEEVEAIEESAEQDFIRKFQSIMAKATLYDVIHGPDYMTELVELYRQSYRPK